MRKKIKPLAKRRSRNQLSADSYLRSNEVAAVNAVVSGAWVNYAHATNCMIVELFLHTGLRSEELADLEMRDLPHFRHRLSVKVRHGKGNVERIIDVSQYLSDRLKAYCDIYRVKARDTSPLFASQRGGCLCYTSIYRKVKSIGKAAGVDRLRPHILRHTYGTYLLSKLKNIRLVQEQMGHASVKTTQIYTGVIECDLHAKLGSIYG
jgi:integrase/recombinase XerD